MIGWAHVGFGYVLSGVSLSTTSHLDRLYYHFLLHLCSFILIFSGANAVLRQSVVAVVRFLDFWNVDEDGAVKRFLG